MPRSAGLKQPAQRKGNLVQHVTHVNNSDGDNKKEYESLSCSYYLKTNNEKCIFILKRMAEDNVLKQRNDQAAVVTLM